MAKKIIEPMLKEELPKHRFKRLFKAFGRLLFLLIFWQVKAKKDKKK